MTSLWQKTRWYLGLVDDDEQGPEVEQAPPQPTQSRVRTVEQPRSTPASGVQPPGSRTTGAIAGRRIEPPARQRRTMSSNPEHAEAGVLVHPAGESSGRPEPQPAPSSALAQSEIIEARTFSDAQMLADNVRDGRPVVLDLRNTEPAMVRRLVDFSTGLTYALDGRMAKIAQGVILVTSKGASLGLEEKRRLADLGLYMVEE